MSILTLHFCRNLLLKIFSTTHPILGATSLSGLIWHVMPSASLQNKFFVVFAGSFFLIGIIYRLFRITLFSTTALIELCFKRHGFTSLRVQTKNPITITPRLCYYIIVRRSMLRYKFITTYPVMACWQQSIYEPLPQGLELVFLINDSKHISVPTNLPCGQQLLLDGQYSQTLEPQNYDIFLLIAEGRGIANIIPLAINVAARKFYDKSKQPKQQNRFRDRTRRIDLF